MYEAETEFLASVSVLITSPYYEPSTLTDFSHPAILSEEINVIAFPSHEKVIDITYSECEYYGEVCKVRWKGSAREAMKAWLKAIDELNALGIRKPIFYEWTGELDLSPEELGRFLAEALLKMGLPLATKEPFDAAAILRKERE